eukprot:361264-Chlamydomonas_euryale.AAC.4
MEGRGRRGKEARGREGKQKKIKEEREKRFFAPSQKHAFGSFGLLDSTGGSTRGVMVHLDRHGRAVHQDNLWNGATFTLPFLRLSLPPLPYTYS